MTEPDTTPEARVTERGVTPLAQAFYEGMFILDSGKFAADPDAAGREVLGIIEKVGGTAVAHRPWEDRKLAYQIGRHRKGLYYLAFFTAESTAVNDIRGIVKLNDNIIRHLILSHDKALFDQMVEMLGGDAFRHAPEEGEAAEGTPEKKVSEEKVSEESAEPAAK